MIKSKWFASILIFTILFVYVAPQMTLASTNNTKGPSTSAPSATLHKNVTRLTELVDKRDQHSKTYLNSDGSYTTETSYASRHYQDAQGKWQDISNKIGAASDDPTFAFRDQANLFQPHFAKDSQAPFLAKVTLDKTRSLAWSMANAAQSTATNDTNSVTFPNILPSTDLQYQPFSDGLKENIILKDPAAPASFTFQLTVTGLTVAPQEDGSFGLNDAKSGETKSIIPRSYMYDHNQKTSQAVTTSVTPTKSPGIYTVTITPDATWIADPGRAFPIVIDPSVTTVNWGTDIGSTGLDTYVNSATPTTQYYSSNDLKVGWDNNGISRTLLKFALPTLPSGAIATDAILKLNKRSTNPAASEEIDVARVTSPWQYSVTWGSKPTADTVFDVTEQSVVNVPGSTTGWITFNVWSIVKSWLNSGNGDLLPKDNFGLMVQFPTANETSAHPAYTFISSNDPSGLGPLLSLTYITDQIGSNPYWSYANIEGGSVNTMSGNFISSVTDFSLPGRGIPINVTRTYNSRSTFNGLFGQKWISNLDMQLSFQSWGAVLIDSAGTERPFLLNGDGQTYTRPDNYPVQLYKGTIDGATVYRVQDANSETNQYSTNLPTLTFDSTGKLIKLEDGKGNTTAVTRTSNSVTITDPSNRTATLALNANGTVNSLTTSEEPGKTKTSYTYTNGYLQGVTYDNSPNGTSTINYEWDVYHNLLSFTNKNGAKTYLYYDAFNRVISSGPVNSLVNPSFEATTNPTAPTYPDRWSAPQISQDAGTIELSSTAKYAGNSLNIHSVYQAGTSGTSSLWTKQRISVQPNTPYVLSAYIKTASLLGIAFLNVEELDSNGNHIKWKDNSGSPVTGTTDWTRKTLTINPTTATTAFIDVYVEVTHNQTSFGGDAYFDGIQLQDGTTATDFQGHTDFRYGTDGAYQACWVTKASGELTEYKNNNYGTPAAIIQDPVGPKRAETQMIWDAADHLHSLKTPNQVALGASGKSYVYEYFPIGNMKQATDPLGNTTSMDYTFNKLNKLTAPDGTVVRTVWNPQNLTEETNVNQTMNSTAYMRDPDTGNLTSQSNQLGLADNRVYNSSFESVTGTQPTDWTAYSPAGTTFNRVEWDANAPSGGSNVLHINPGTNYNAYQWSTQYIPVDGNPYTISAYMRANGTAAAPNGAYINIYWYNSSYTQVGSTQNYFDARSNQWQRYIAANIIPPTGAAYAKVMAITYGPYDGYFDNIQLEQTPQARGYNYLENSSFIRGNTRWNFSDANASIFNDGSNDDTNTHAFSDTYDGKIERTTTGTSYLEAQTTPTLNSGQDYTIYGFMRTKDIIASSGGGARVHVVVTDSQGVQKDYSMPYPVTVNAATPWTKYSFSFSPTASGKAKVRLELTNASGKAWFDDIRLSPGNMITKTDYDSNKNYVTSITDQKNRKTTLTNDKYGQPLTVTSQSGEQMTYGYDGQERLLSATDNAGSIANYTLDANGNIKASSLTAGTSTYDQSSFVYDVRNNLTTETDALGKVTTYKYDEGGRLTSKLLPNGSTIMFSYDQVDNISQVQLSSGEKYVYTYDLEGRPKDIKVYSGANMTNQIQATYDAIGNLIGYVDGNLGTVSSSSVVRDQLNRITNFNLTYGGASIPYGFSYTGNGLPSTVTADSKNFSLIYDDGDKLINRNNPDGTRDIYTYNDANQVTGVQTAKVDTSSGGVTLDSKWSNQYSFDADGRINAVAGTRPSGANLSESYTYNNAPEGTEKLNRLTKAVIDGTTFNYQYDPAGNITSMSLPYFGTKTFSYDADNRITNSGFSYDNNGNLTSAAMYGTNYQYSYDSADRLTTVKDINNNLIASYTYDSDGNRLTKTANGTTTAYHYFQGQLMYETVGSTITAVYLRSADGSLLGVKLNGSYYYYHYDAQGNVEAVTDSNGAVYRQYVYDPYGNIISVKDGSGTAVNISNDLGFNNAYTYRGYRFDSETGLYFLNSRYYAAGIGRLLTKDTFKGAAEDPRTLNRYAYAVGDPVNYVDHDGHRPAVGGGPEGLDVYNSVSPTPYRPNEKNNSVSEVLGIVSTVTSAGASASSTALGQVSSYLADKGEVVLANKAWKYNMYTLAVSSILSYGFLWADPANQGHRFGVTILRSGMLIAGIGVGIAIGAGIAAVGLTGGAALAVGVISNVGASLALTAIENSAIKGIRKW